MKTKERRSLLAPVGLAAVMLVIVGSMLASGKTGRVEAIGFFTGAVCVWLTVKENVWNFPVGLVNVTLFSFVFFEQKLYAATGLQVVYFGLGCLGWYWWLHGGDDRGNLKLATASWRERLLVIVLIAVSTIGLWTLLSHVGGSASFWDALTASISLGAQWLLSRKRIENWIAWIVVDAIYVPLYLYKGLTLTAILYTVLLCMATIGLVVWLRRMRQASCETVAGPA